MNIHKNKNKLISILGDSISTFEEFTPPIGVFYNLASASTLGVCSVNETWWMQVIKAMNAKLLVNNSYAGSTISRKGHWPACSLRRIRALSAEGNSPDIILIFSGLNDVDYCIPYSDFAEDYAQMLTLLKEYYPAAELWCSTLCRGHLSETPYNEVIRSCVQNIGVHLADLASFGEKYSATDGVHPDAKGMEQLANLWLECLISE